MKKTRQTIFALLLIAASAVLTNCNPSNASEVTQNSTPADEPSTTAQAVPTDTTVAATEVEAVVPPNLFTITGCTFPIRIIAGDSFSFPEGLEDLGLYVEPTQNGGYQLSSGEGDEGNDYSQMDVSIADTATSIAFDGKGSNQPTVITIKNGTVYIERNGTKVAYGDKGSTKVYKVYGTSKGVLSQITITVPRNASLNADVAANLKVEAPLESLTLTSNSDQGYNVSIAKAKTVSLIEFSQKGALTIDSAGIIQSIETGGVATVKVGTCDSIATANAEGASTIDLSKDTKVGKRSMAGTASIH